MVDGGMDMITRKGIAAFALVLAVAAAGQIFAADVIIIDTGRAKKDAKEVGKDYAELGKQIAEDAEDFAEDIAEQFSDAFD